MRGVGFSIIDGESGLRRIRTGEGSLSEGLLCK